MKKLEYLFEGGLWGSRYVVLLAVVSSLATSVGMFYMATVDAFYMILHMLDYGSPAMAADVRSVLRAESITHIVEIIDAYLLATVLLIFALGLYELFISKIDQAASDESSSRVLFITSLDDLKARLPWSCSTSLAASPSSAPPFSFPMPGSMARGRRVSTDVLEPRFQ